MKSTTFERIRQNKNIKADRFGMAAISCIFNAFGDKIRSKEFWPWGDVVNIPWEESSGTITELGDAIRLLTEAQIRSDYEGKVEIKRERSNNIKELRRRLAHLNINKKTLNSVTDNINNTSKETKTIIENIK